MMKNVESIYIYPSQAYPDLKIISVFPNKYNIQIECRWLKT
ncbi:MAG: hypothetical protein QXV17_10820 [Candidatus Micrarchaeaceae archaeon]